MIAGRIKAAALAGAGSLALTGCFLSPGEFESTLVLNADRSFTYSYDGQIYAFALDNLKDLAAEADPDPCYDDEGDERPCSADELEAQKAARVQQAQMMQQMMSGGDPETAEEMAAHLERQAGWNSVEYLGDGLFDVDFAIGGTLSYDFGFPTVEGMPAGAAFVSANLRDGAQVRVEAPGFTPAGGNPMSGMFGGLMGMMAAKEAGESAGGKPNPFENMVQPSGTFRIVTQGRILANNTDEGPSDGASGQVLEWAIGPQTQAAPMALIAFD